MLVEGSPFHHGIGVDYGYFFPSFFRARAIWMYPACWRSSCWRGGHSGLISWRYFFFGNQSRLRGFCGSCCFLGSCGRLIFFPCDVVHSFHLGFVWGWGGSGGALGSSCYTSSENNASFVYSYLPSRFANANILCADFLPRVEQAH